MIYTAIINRRILATIAAAYLLSTLDLFLTAYAINAGIGYEGNMALAGTTIQGIGLLKTVGLLALTYFSWSRPRILNLVTVVMALVCAWNMLVITGQI